jgi:hypothetical protein
VDLHAQPTRIGGTQPKEAGMVRRVVTSVVFLSLAFAPAAVADGYGPSPGVLYGWTGVTGTSQPFRYVTFVAGRRTVLAAVRRATGSVWQWRPLVGTWGVPLVTNDGTAGGLSRDGRLLVLAEWGPPRAPVRTTSRFLILNTKTFRVWRRITLKGDFVFDALSPGARTLYLIEHVSATDLTRYRLRAYDLVTRRLLPRVIADRRQEGWTMQGLPVTRAASPDARWVYTLYQQPGGYPFVHALDSVARTAVCVGIPWRGNQDIVPSVHLRLDPRAGRLTIETRRGRALFAIDTRTFWVSRPAAARPGGFLARALRP